MQIFEEEDLPYEEECIRNPYNVKSWLRYIDHKTKSKNPVSVYLIYERALKLLSGSYKLWHQYLKYRRLQLKGKCITDNEYEELNNTFERSLSYMHKMPRIWLEYSEFLLEQCFITRTRKNFDKALRSLPITQHNRIWPLYLKLIESYDISDTGLKVYRRYLKLQPENTEDYVEYLKKIQLYDECAQKYVYMLNTDEFKSKYNKSKHQLWHELCDLISKNPTKIHSIKVEPIFRQGIERYKDQVGQLWNSLASYYIGLGNFEKARDIYEEGMTKVITVRDFTQIFDAYSKFEEEIISDQMEQANMQGLSEEDDLELEIRLARLEYLMDRRPLLLNRVLLRQNPHNVQEWLKRVSLYEDKPREIIDTFKEALEIVDPKQAIGKYSQIWTEFAKYYEKNNQLDDSRFVFEKAIKATYKNVDDLASIWCEWCEMELRHDNALKAIKLMERATQISKKKTAFFDQNESVQNRLYKSLKLWSMYVDLEESFGSFKSCKAVYDKIIELRIATPQIIINFGLYLEENNYFEEAFKVYEKGVSIFKWPNVYDIWLKYLTQFIKRYEGSKIERLRDLFEQCLENCPQKFNMEIYLLFAKLEENHGLARRALKIYERACDSVSIENRYEMFNIYIKQAASMKGVTATREIFEKAIEVLPDDQVREMGMRYADMERKLGEIDRARSIYAYISQLCDPRSTQNFWQQWKEFEIAHGNEDTVREMLRIKRSVQATYNVQVNFMSAQMVSTTGEQISAGQVAPSKENEDPMSHLDAQANKKATQEVSKTSNKGIMFVRSTDQPKEASVTDQSVINKNPDEIQIEDLNIDEETENV
jgi:pre-mRNA-splicing factor SYF1